MTKRLDPSVFVHDLALCESIDIGPRTRVWAFAHVMPNVAVGADCNICDHVFIESGAVVGNRVTVKNNVLIWDKVTIEDDVFLGPNAVFTNDLNPRAEFKKTPAQFSPTLVRQGCSVGANATIVCGITLHPYSMVGAGSVVVSDVPAYALVVGNPSRRVGWVCECGIKLTSALECACGRQYRPRDGNLERAN